VACQVGGGSEEDASGAESGSVESKIENAMSAAPEAIAMGATILDWPSGSGSTLPVLREGSNGWVCYPSSPDIPHDNPQCRDQVAAVHAQAMGVGAVPPITSIGVSYMLAGGGFASASDPSISEPPDGETWQAVPPHVMLFFPPGMLDSAGLPVDPGSGGPWVMWAGTPAAHIMVPVGPEPSTHESDLEPGTPEWEIQDAMSAAPAGVSAEATIVSWAGGGAGSGPSVIRAGTNGWTCFPASPATPADDPTCGNEAWGTWVDAWISKTVPQLRAIGFSYWLKPSMAASNDDPAAMTPPPGQDWIPHPQELSVHLPDQLFELAAFPSDQDAGGPWIMFAETPYAHLMIPLR